MFRWLNLSRCAGEAQPLQKSHTCNLLRMSYSFRCSLKRNMSLYFFKVHSYAAFHPSDLGLRLVTLKFQNPRALLQELIRMFQVLFCIGVSCIRSQWYTIPPLGSDRISHLPASPTFIELTALALNL